MVASSIPSNTARSIRSNWCRCCATAIAGSASHWRSWNTWTKCGRIAPLLPSTARERQRVRSLALLVACDIHPLNNLRVLQYFENEWNVPQPERDEWVRHWIVDGFTAAEAMLADHPSTGEYCEGNTPGYADCCLIPQIYNARRFGVDMDQFPTMQRIEAACLAMPAFDAARPERQPDAPAQKPD